MAGNSLDKSTGYRVSKDDDPEKLVGWMLERFSGQRIVMTSAFGMEGCALVDMIAARVEQFTVVYLDTHFFFEQTHALIERFKVRYPHVSFENQGTLMTPAEQAEQYGPELWKRDPDLCCRLRKVDPMAEVMKDADVWVTGLRRSQSQARARLQTVEWDWQYDVLKVNPLANWDRKDVWAYIQAHKVPYNALHEQGYPSVGCTHCTKVVPGASITDYSRDGRWEGQSKSECGLHGYGI